MNAVAKKPSIEPDRVLQEVNGFVAILDFTVRVNRLTNCMVANSLSQAQAEGEKKSQPLSKNLMFKEMVAEQQALCQLFEMAVTETKTTFDEIRARKKLLDHQFVFSIVRAASNGNQEALAEEEIGLFSSPDSCSKVELFARDHGIPTRKCHEWKDVLERSKGA